MKFSRKVIAAYKYARKLGQASYEGDAAANALHELLGRCDVLPPLWMPEVEPNLELTRALDEACGFVEVERNVPNVMFHPIPNAT